MSRSTAAYQNTNPELRAARSGASVASVVDIREWRLVEKMFNGHYAVQGLVARGGMGSVYVARDRVLERSVAIKVLLPEVSENPERRERFRAEARVMARLSHPNIVPLHAVGETDGLLWFVMGYVAGESLAERMRKRGRMAPNEACRLLADLADALDYAHRRGIVHRDVKPDNVL